MYPVKRERINFCQLGIEYIWITQLDQETALGSDPGTNVTCGIGPDMPRVAIAGTILQCMDMNAWPTLPRDRNAIIAVDHQRQCLGVHSRTVCECHRKFSKLVKCRNIYGVSSVFAHNIRKRQPGMLNHDPLVSMAGCIQLKADHRAKFGKCGQIYIT